MNLVACAKNYERVILKRIQFDVRKWAKNYEEKILQPRILREEIEELKRIEEKYKRERRERIRQMREHQNNMRIKHQKQEFEAIKRVRQEERRWDIPLYCAAPRWWSLRY